MNDYKARKSMLIETLKENQFNITDACEAQGITLAEFEELKEDQNFCDKLKEVDQSVRDFARSKMLSLVSQGDRNATIEYNKWLRQSDDDNLKLISRKKTMKILIETQDNKAICLRKFSDVFDESGKMAEKYYQITMTEYNLVSPAQRKKEEAHNNSQKLSERFKNGELSEEDMLNNMMETALRDSEESEYPSERSKARADVISIHARMEEIRERKRREAEEDDTPLHLKADALLFGSSPEHVRRVNDMIESHELKRIEAAQ